MRKDNQRGAIVVEATLSLTAFVFTIFTILTLVNVCYIQAKMSVALNSAAKEISQYSYLYYKVGLDKANAAAAEGKDKAETIAKNTIDGALAIYSSMSDIQNDIEDGEIYTPDGFETMCEELEKSGKTAKSLLTQYANELSEDPKGFLMGVGKLALATGLEEIKEELGEVLAEAFMKKNLVAHKDDTPDRFLKHYGIEDGMAGLDFEYSSLMAYGKSNLIQLCVTYDVHVIKLLNVDFKFKFRQVAKAEAWGNGISLITPSQNDPDVVAKTTVWDNPSDTERGKIIVLEEKKNFTYTSSGKGFDAYDNSGGKNQFVTIMSINTHMASYQTAGPIKNQISNRYTKMKDGVSSLGDPITVNNQSGATVTVPSNPATRKYKVILVVPADSDMSVVTKAIGDFKAANPDVEVVLNTGHGSPTPKSDDDGKEDEEGETE